jgi:hypothetical protein
MSDPREPHGSTRERRSPGLTAAVFSRLKCPNCGREPAIVFPLIGDDHVSVEGAPLVCLECCLTAREKL